MQKSLITLIVDRSLSMKPHVERTISALNEYLDTVKEAKTDTRVSLVTFASNGAVPDIRKIFVAHDIKALRPLTSADMPCGGNTPLLTTVRETILAVADSLKGRTDIRPILVIQTDGEENTSVGVTHADVKALISEKQKQGWEFVFMGCGVDAYKDGMKMGLSQEKILSYGQDAVATRSAFRATAEATSAYLKGTEATMSYSAAQKADAGDLYAHRGG